MLFCFNCKNTNHGFKSCNIPLKLCTACNTKGHSSEQCEYFSTLCYRCSEIGQLTTREECEKHKGLKRCGAIIMDSDKNILIVQNHSGIWSIPKGHQSHRKEPYSVCAMREVYEETGLKLKITRNFKQIEVGNIVYYLIVLNDFYKKFIKTRDTDEIKQMTWINISDIMTLDDLNWSLRQVGSYLKLISL